MSKKPKRQGQGYAVGRGKPPEHTRFKPGQSGNPKGRKRGALNLKTVLAAVLETEVEVNEHGRRRSVPLLEALILRLAQEGLKGRPAAIDSLLDRFERHVGVGSEALPELAEEDLALIARGLERREEGNG